MRYDLTDLKEDGAFLRNQVRDSLPGPPKGAADQATEQDVFSLFILFEHIDDCPADEDDIR